MTDLIALGYSIIGVITAILVVRYMEEVRLWTLLIVLVTNSIGWPVVWFIFGMLYALDHWDKFNPVIWRKDDE